MPKTVRFDKTGNIIVFSMHGGIVVLLDSITGNTLWRKSDAPRSMATVSLDEDCQNFVVCTEQGFELWDFERMIQTKEIEQAPISLSLPKHACFSEWKTKVIGGTDRACAEVYDVTNGRFEQRLAYPQGGLVQAVAAFPANDRFLVAVAGANGRRACDVILWYKKHFPPTARKPGSSDEYYTFRIKKWYLKLMFYILCVVWVAIIQTLIILNNTEALKYYACHEKLNLCRKSHAQQIEIRPVMTPTHVPYVKERRSRHSQSQATARYGIVHAVHEQVNSLHSDKRKVLT
ncbi:hypothetical protein F5880DRAFT_1619376 [Lentinula raphanica]|nr:hypothetical protein F5880DRAFT_1619376 [Lentinula raphanica]